MPPRRSVGPIAEPSRASTRRPRGRWDPIARPSSETGSIQLSSSTETMLPELPQPATGLLDPQITIERLGNITSGSENFFFIQLNSIRVRIHDPARGTRRADCSCDEFGHTQSSCEHLRVSSPVSSMAEFARIKALPVVTTWIECNTSNWPGICCAKLA